MTITQPCRAIIAGGGIGGLTTAIALRRIGIDVEIYERTPQLRERGAAIVLWPNATGILRDLGVLDSLIQKSNRVTHCEIRSWKGRPIKRWNVPELPTPAIFIHRGDLQSTLLASLPHGIIHLDQTVSGFDQDESRVRVHFTSGQMVEGDVLIGADGIHSNTRKQMFGEQHPIYQGYTQWLGMVPEAHEILKPGLKMEWWGRGVRFGIGINGRGRMNWYLSVNQPMPEASVVDKARLLEWVRGWQEPVEEIIRSTPGETIIPIDIWACPASEAWGRGRVTLLGDAAHPTSPNLGQGAGMAIEDAGCLASCLGAESAPVAALRRYESLRKRRTAAITSRSDFIGRMAQWNHPALVAARTAFLHAIPLSLWERRLKSLYSYQIDVP